jgi:hypothetical protein
MATSLSQLWGLELYPSVVLQETAYLFAAYRHSWLQNLATFLSEMVSSRRVSASLFIAIGVEICRMLSTIRSQCIVRIFIYFIYFSFLRISDLFCRHKRDMRCCE